MCLPCVMCAKGLYHVFAVCDVCKGFDPRVMRTQEPLFNNTVIRYTHIAFPKSLHVLAPGPPIRLGLPLMLPDIFSNSLCFPGLIIRFSLYFYSISA